MRFLLLSLIALVLVPAALSAGPRVQTISGTVSANSGSSLTVTSGDRSLTCRVLGEKAQAALARWGVGVKAAMGCKREGDRLVLTRLARLDSKDGTAKSAPPTSTDGTTTREPRTTPPPTTPLPTTTTEQPRRDARGKVSALGGGSITVTRDNGTSLTCSVTDAQAREIATGAPVGTAVVIVCAGDGDHLALVSLQRAETNTSPPATTPPPPPATTPPPPPPTTPDRRDARGIVTALSSDSVTVRPDAGGDSLRCRITPAADSASAAAKLSLGAHVGIVCRRDGDGYVLSGTTPIS
jgi:hypothetical protein